MNSDDEALYLEKVKREIETIKASGKEFWYDFSLTKDKLKILKDNLSSLYKLDVRDCIECGTHDVTIEVKGL